MTKLLSLEYPNGRTHEFTHAQDVKAGEEFELFGHRWTAVGKPGRGGRYARVDRNGDERLVCRQS
jgi:hypothetical protein